MSTEQQNGREPRWRAAAIRFAGWVRARLPHRVRAEADRLADQALARLGGVMTKDERAMLDGLRGGREPARLLRTRTRVDVGEWCNPWWGGAPLWLAIIGDEIVVFAHGKRPYVERLPMAGLGGSRYNAVTSELVLAASQATALRRLKVPPVEGWQVVEYMTDKKRGD